MRRPPPPPRPLLSINIAVPADGLQQGCNLWDRRRKVSALGAKHDLSLEATHPFGDL